MKLHGVSDGTVKRTMRELVQEGLIYTVNGRGSYVSDLRQTASSPPATPAQRPVVAIAYGRRPNEVIGNLFYSGMLQGIEEELGKTRHRARTGQSEELPVPGVVGRPPARLLLGHAPHHHPSAGRSRGPGRQRAGDALSAGRVRSRARGSTASPTTSGLVPAKPSVTSFRPAARPWATIVVPQRASYSDLRWQGFLQGFEERGAGYDEGLVEPADWSMEGVVPGHATTAAAPSRRRRRVCNERRHGYRRHRSRARGRAARSRTTSRSSVSTTSNSRASSGPACPPCGCRATRSADAR